MRAWTYYETRVSYSRCIPREGHEAPVAQAGRHCVWDLLISGKDWNGTRPLSGILSRMSDGISSCTVAVVCARDTSNVVPMNRPRD